MRKVPFMPTEHIEAASLCLLAEYGRKYGEVVAPPVPVEAVLEAHLGLSLDFDDLPGLVGTPDVLGATWIQDRRVLVDQSLDPEENPSREGRYHFTVAHEVGHWELHRRFFVEDAAPAVAFWGKEIAVYRLPDEFAEGADGVAGGFIRRLPADAQGDGAEGVAGAMRQS